MSYKNLSPFRFWCQKVLPIVYDDSLSYYELLSKVVGYINSIIGDVNYLAQYFNTPEFRADIQSALDAMAESGELTRLLDSLKYKTPEMYGGMGDGVTDDTVAIQDMFDHCNEGDLCIFTAKKYLITSQINISTNFLRCTGWERSEFSPCLYSTAVSGAIFYVTGSGCSFDRLMFQGLGRGNTTLAGVIYDHDNQTANGNTDSDITNSCFYALEYGVMVYGRNLHCINTFFSALRYGVIWKQTTTATQLRGHVVKGCTFHGVVYCVTNEINNMLPEKNLIVEGNLLNGGSSVLFTGYEGNLVIAENTVFQNALTEGGGNCIDVSAGIFTASATERNMIKNNVIKLNSNDYAGIRVSGCKCNVEGNYIENTGRRGIYTESAAACVIKNNSVVNAYSWGIEGSNDTTGVIADNACINCNLYAGGMKSVHNTVDAGLILQTSELTVLEDGGGTVNKNLCNKVGNVVTVSGGIIEMDISAGTTDYFNIPVGYRPNFQLFAMGYVTTETGFNPVLINIYPNGNVRFAFSESQTAGQIGFSATYAVQG